LNAIAEATVLAQPDTDQDVERDKEISSAGRALFLAAFTVVVGSFTVALMTYVLGLTY
jgi:hypothetical protein